MDRLIRLAERRRFPEAYAQWTHCAIALHPDEIVEATARGVHLRPYPQYETERSIVVPTHGTIAQRFACAAFLESCLGKPYGFLTALSAGCALLTGGRLTVFLDGTDICSGLAAEALCRLGYIFPREPIAMTPAALAYQLIRKEAVSPE